MDDKYKYNIPDNPEYNSKIRKLQDDDWVSATKTFNPLFEQMIENTAAVKAQADELEEKVGQVAREDSLKAHLEEENPHKVTKMQLGLGSVDNTRDLDKPISTSMRGALDAVDEKAEKAYAAALEAAVDLGNMSSIAIGKASVAANINSMAIGFNARALHNGAISLGIDARGGVGSISIGENSVSTRALTVTIGPNSSTAGQSASAIGSKASAKGESAAALGAEANAHANYSTALGCKAVATGQGSAALGYRANTANYGYSVAVGYNAAVTTPNSIRLGSADATEYSAIYSIRNIAATSDERDKANIQPVKKALEFLNSLETIQYVDNARTAYLSKQLTDEQKQLRETYAMHTSLYDRKAHEEGMKKGQRKRIGISAQDIQKNMLKVYETDNYAELVHDNLYDRRQSGEKFPEGVESMLSVNYTGFIPFLIKAVQELTEKDNQTTKMIEELKEQIKMNSSVSGQRE